MDVMQMITFCQEKLTILDKIIPTQDYQQRLSVIDEQLNSPGLWNDPRSAASLMKERGKLSEALDNLSAFREQVQFYQELALYPPELEKEGTNLFILLSKMADVEFKQMMKDPLDDSVAILSISAGAGGLEAANWVSMLLRMYSRYAAAHGFKTDILDMKESEEHSAICIDSVSIQVSGPYAFGYLKSESGVHRLIRNSPFNAADARQTSFAAVSVLPDIEDQIKIDVNENDLEITTMRGSGPGGQAINKIESAVRMKHIPTGIVVNSRAERSQHANRKFAMKMLKAKLYDAEVKRKMAEADKRVAEQSNVSFGSQIRTYTLMPYQLVKDHRTEYETSQAQTVLDGDIEQFLLAYLRE